MFEHDRRGLRQFRSRDLRPHSVRARVSAGAALLFAATAAATLVWCNAMPAVAQPVARKRPGLLTNMIAIDLPGFVRSERKDASMSPRAMGNLIVHVADTSGLDHSHVVGPDVVTSASLFAAALQPGRYRSLVGRTGGSAGPRGNRDNDALMSTELRLQAKVHP